MLVAHHHYPEPKGQNYGFGWRFLAVKNLVDRGPIKARLFCPRLLAPRLIHFGAEQIDDLLLFKNSHRERGIG